MKRLLVSLVALPVLLAVGCGKDSICSLNDDDCDGVPDDLGCAWDKDKEEGPDLVEFDGDVYWAVDLNCDGAFNLDDDALGYDSNGDGYLDSVIIDPEGAALHYTTGDDLSAPPTGDGDGDAVIVPGDGDGDAVIPGDGDGDTVTPGDGDGDGDGDTVTNPWDEIPDVDVGDWYAPIQASAEANLGVEFQRWKNSFLRDCGGGKLSVPMDGNRLVSEGMGYGMLIMAGLGTQAEFDGMYATYRDAPKTAGGLMQWDCNACGTSCGASNGQAASDADIDAAMALLQAEVRFGGGTYLSAARDLIAKIRVSVMKNCSGNVYLVAGEWDPNCENLNPSYFAPGYYRAFANVDTLGSGVWNNAIDDAYAVLDSQKASGSNGLWPDGMGGNCYSCNGYDACRVPWRLATDYAWSGDERAAALLNYTAGKVDQGGFGPLSTNHNSAFHGALALSGMPAGQAKLDSYYNTWINGNPQDNLYYQGTLRVIYLMLAAGQFPSTLPSSM